MGFIQNILTLALSFAMIILTAAQTSYNSKTQLCCNGTVTNIEGSSGNMACCGDVAYNYVNQTCCRGNQVFDRPMDNPYNYECCQDYETSADATGLYNSQTQQCCNGVVSNKPDPDLFYGCCDGQLFDWSTHLCCGKQLLERGLDEECCGDQQVYNTKSQVCCTVYGQISDNKWGETEVSLHDRESNTDVCCGLEKYDYTEAVCCDGDIVKPKESNSPGYGGCCNGEPYEFSKQICCTTWGKSSSGHYDMLESQLHERETGTESCCGTEVFDYQDSVCCNGNATRPKPEGADRNNWLQCCGDGVITDYRTQVCINDKVVELKNCHSWICGEKEYDGRTQFCCGNDVYDSATDMECCDQIQLVYDKTTHQCCSDKIIPLSDEDHAAGNDACCAVQ